MNALCKRLATLIVCCASCVALNGCIIGSLSGGLRYGTETAFITVDGTTHNCDADVSTERYRCVWTAFLGPNMTDPVYNEVDIVMTGIDVFTRYIRDPLIVQVPAEATGFTGTINDGPGVTPGTPLSITAGLTSIPIDVNTTLQAEPGMQLVIIDFPSPDTAALGAYTFTVSYSGGGTLFKALFAAKIATGGKTYYPPIYPCITDFANMPAIDPSFSLARIVPVYTNIGGCTDKVYNFATNGATAVDVIEFYNASLDHYFITWVAQEISDLDNGVHKGWARTGKTFKTYTTAQTGTSPVCRFYIPRHWATRTFSAAGRWSAMTRRRNSRP